MNNPEFETYQIPEEALDQGVLLQLIDIVKVQVADTLSEYSNDFKTGDISTEEVTEKTALLMSQTRSLQNQIQSLLCRFLI